ncbi:Na/Pi cotransporter family protein [Shimia thalassica]|uniref:Na/Pi cotransporter family protein n=1 Tax=Shimia thalassica TaxID=1715693 RepID=UPI0026E20DFB|nr:Na/Pi symporter [Shimia thalassica]MDO6480553.1 Na/Pi symporter [Shimia thalassica]
MNEYFFLAVGGIGMFLLGMKIMTNALREAAGGNLRDWLSRFTTTPLRGVMTGAITTAIIQSSSATSVMVVGFVGAGLLSLGQALGVLYGANIGTTATGWIVSLLGFKLQLGSLAMALLFPAALLDLLAHGTLARVGRVVAGLCLLLVGLEFLQDGMKGLTEGARFDMLPSGTLGSVLLLLLIGAVFTILVQSSSAAVALALVLLDGGVISVSQATAMVIGMNIGTTFTAMMASVGGSRPMRQTAVGNLVFNLVTSALALPVAIFAEDQMTALAVATDPMTALLLFHLGFNVVGTALFLPFTSEFAAFIARLVPETKTDSLISLDRALLQDPGTALIAAQTALITIVGRLFDALGSALQPEPDLRLLAALAPVEEAVEELVAFLEDIRLPEGVEDDEKIYTELLHQTDHVMRLLEHARRPAFVQILLEDRILRRPALAVGAALLRHPPAPLTERDAERLARLHRLVEHRRKRHRRAMLLGEHAGMYSVSDVFSHTDAMRWLDRVLHHAERIAKHYETFHKVRPEFPEEAQQKTPA